MCTKAAPIHHPKFRDTTLKQRVLPVPLLRHDVDIPPATGMKATDTPGLFVLRKAVVLLSFALLPLVRHLGALDHLQLIDVTPKALVLPLFPPVLQRLTLHMRRRHWHRNVHQSVLEHFLWMNANTGLKTHRLTSPRHAAATAEMIYPKNTNTANHHSDVPDLKMCSETSFVLRLNTVVPAHV